MSDHILPIPKSFFNNKRYTAEQWEVISRICIPKTYDDLVEYATQCGYSSGWAYYKAKDFNIPVNDTMYSYVIEDGEGFSTIYSDVPL